MVLATTCRQVPFRFPLCWIVGSNVIRHITCLLQHVACGRGSALGGSNEMIVINRDLRAMLDFEYKELLV